MLAVELPVILLDNGQHTKEKNNDLKQNDRQYNGQHTKDNNDL
jgi:hypothetical protein